jgi:hypothetical protein
MNIVDLHQILPRSRAQSKSEESIRALMWINRRAGKPIAAKTVKDSDLAGLKDRGGVA